MGWFDTELEGVITYEALMAPFAPLPNTTRQDLTSDKAISLIAFGGVGQHFLVGRESPLVRETLETYCVPADAQYLIDFTYMEKYAVRERMAKYGSIACFNSRKELTRIYVSHWQEWVARPCEHPSSEDAARLARRWEHAKFVVKACMGTGMTLKDHLMNAHWIVSNCASIALRSCLDRDHPVRRLMHMFIFRSPSVNLASVKSLMPEHLYVHRAAGFSYDGLTNAMEDCAKSWKFQTFPEFIEEKCLGVVESELSLVQDGMEYWNVLHEFTKAYLSIYYINDDDVVNDYEIGEFWRTLDSMPQGPPAQRGQGVAPGFGYKLPDLAGGKGAFENLANCLCHIMFWVTANHEILGSVIEYFTTPMGLTTKIYDESFSDGDCVSNIGADGQVMADVQTFLQDLSVISLTGYRQPPLICNWARLMHIQPSDEKKWNQLTLDVQQVSRINRYLRSPQCTTSDKEPMLGINGLNASRETWHPSTVQEHQLWSDRVERDLRSLGQPSRDAVKFHNELIDDLHLAFMSSLTRLSNEIELRNASRERPFRGCDPALMEASVSI